MIYIATTYNKTSKEWLFTSGNDFLTIPDCNIRGDKVFEGKEYVMERKGRRYFATLADTPENTEFLTRIPNDK